MKRKSVRHSRVFADFAVVWDRLRTPAEGSFGSPGRIRTSDQPVNRGTAYRAAFRDFPSQTIEITREFRSLLVRRMPKNETLQVPCSPFFRSVPYRVARFVARFFAAERAAPGPPAPSLIERSPYIVRASSGGV